MTTARSEVASLRRLARLHGIQASYTSDSRRVTASVEALLAALRALGAEVTQVGGVPAALRERIRALESRILEPVHVLWDGGPGFISWRPASGSAECSLRLESGDTLSWRQAAGTPLSLPALPYGYHELTVRLAGKDHRCLVISAPSRAYSPGQPDPLKAWGAFMPLYALRSAADWGSGDFAGLERLARYTRSSGGSMVATLPLLAAFLDEPFNPSPYAPASRLFWNELYLCLERIPELGACPEARELIASPDFRRGVDRARSEPLVDYRGVMALKRRILALLAKSLSTGRRDAFNRHLKEHPELREYARFRAAGERHRAPWHQWPSNARSGRLTADDVDPEAVRYHEYAQWNAEQQLGALRQDTASHGSSLYFDLPVGASRDSYDVWRHHHLFAEGVSVGAPPDALFAQGQDWSFPPLHPDRIRDDRYTLFIAALRNLLRYAGALRIDHVMGLHRLYWVPHGVAATNGVYVRYQAEEMYAIVCLESHRHRAIIVGEDLGTVPRYVETSLTRHNIYGMYVMQFAVPAATGAEFGHARGRSVACLNTHDTPTFAAWLEGADIDEAERLGFLDAETAAQSRAIRCAQRENLSCALRDRGMATPKPSARELLSGSLRRLAGSHSRLMLVSLEDLWLEMRPQNIPGTTDGQYPNWRRKSARTLEEIEGDPEPARILAQVDKARRAGR